MSDAFGTKWLSKNTVAAVWTISDVFSTKTFWLSKEFKSPGQFKDQLWRLKFDTNGSLAYGCVSLVLLNEAIGNAQCEGTVLFELFDISGRLIGKWTRTVDSIPASGINFNQLMKVAELKQACREAQVVTVRCSITLNEKNAKTPPSSSAVVSLPKHLEEANLPPSEADVTNAIRAAGCYPSRNNELCLSNSKGETFSLNWDIFDFFNPQNFVITSHPFSLVGSFVWIMKAYPFGFDQSTYETGKISVILEQRKPVRDVQVHVTLGATKDGVDQVKPVQFTADFSVKGSYGVSNFVDKNLWSASGDSAGGQLKISLLVKITGYRNHRANSFSALASVIGPSLVSNLPRKAEVSSTSARSSALRTSIAVEPGSSNTQTQSSYSNSLPKSSTSESGQETAIMTSSEESSAVDALLPRARALPEISTAYGSLDKTTIKPTILKTGQPENTLYDDIEFADVTFDIEGVHVKAHRAVLAQHSPKLREIFLSTQNSVVTLMDIKADSFIELKHFIYKNSVEVRSLSHAAQLLKYSRLYKIAALEELCLKHLNDYITDANLSQILIDAHKRGREDIRDICLEKLTKGNVKKLNWGDINCQKDLLEVMLLHFMPDN